MTQIRFHIGAHKTATTHLQMTLARSRLVRGTRYVPLGRLRRFLTSPVRKGRPHLPWHRWFDGTWLLSDENILGTTANALAMYPDPAAALRYFADCDLRIFLCIRCYDTFLPSAWGERLWHHHFCPFDARLPERRWTDVVDDLQTALPDVPIHVWRYEDYRAQSQTIMQRYADGAVTSFPPELAAAPKSGFSARAVAELESMVGHRLGRRRLEAVRRRYPVGPDQPRFDPWRARQKEQLQEMYADDVARLGGVVDVWQPQSPD